MNTKQEQLKEKIRQLKINKKYLSDNFLDLKKEFDDNDVSGQDFQDHRIETVAALNKYIDVCEQIEHLESILPGWL